jgi:hypothetical protein
MACMLSLPNIRNHVRCDLVVKVILDDEAMEWSKSYLLNSRVNRGVHEPFVWSYGWVDNSNEVLYYPLDVQCILIGELTMFIICAL